jgi:MFS family permease
VKVSVLVDSVAGPVFGPIIGGYVTESKSWRWTQWVILFGLVVALSLTLFMSESYKTVLLKRRAKKLGIEPPPELKLSAIQSMQYFVTKTITRPIHMMLTEPIVGLFDVYNAFNFGLLNAFFAAFPWV